MITNEQGDRLHSACTKAGKSYEDFVAVYESVMNESGIVIENKISEIMEI